MQGDRAGDALKSVRQRFHHAAPAPVARGIAFGHEQLQGGQQADDLLLADLAGPADAVLRDSLEPLLIDQRRRRGPLFPADVEIEMLQGGGHDEVAAAA